MASLQVLLSVDVLDKLGVSTTHNLFLDAPDTSTLADFNSFLTDYAPLLDAITDGQITAAHVRQQLALPSGLKSAPASTAEVERTGLFNYTMSGNPYKFGIDVPAIADSKIVSGKINLTDSDILAWKSFILTGVGGITIVSKFLQSLIALVDALISFRKHRKQETRRSLETP
jgi:hypothetical protein